MVESTAIHPHQVIWDVNTRAVFDDPLSDSQIELLRFAVKGGGDCPNGKGSTGHSLEVKDLGHTKAVNEFGRGYTTRFFINERGRRRLAAIDRVAKLAEADELRSNAVLEGRLSDAEDDMWEWLIYQVKGGWHHG